MRALCESCVLFRTSHLQLHFALRTSHSLHSSHSTLHTSHCTLRTPHFTSHCALKTAHFALHTSNFTVRTSHFTLHTALFTLHSSRPTLLTALFTLHTSSHLSSSHLIPAHVFSSHLFSYVTQASMNRFPVLLVLLRTLHAPCSSQARACVLCAKLLQCCGQEHKNMTCARHRCNANNFLRLHIAFFTPHTPHFTLALHLDSSHRSSSHLIPCLPICQLRSSWLFSCQVLSSTDVYYKSLQKPVPSTNLYFKACTKHVPVLLCTTNLAQNTSQYYFALQSLHKTLPCTTLNYKACTKQFPILLCTTKLTQTTSQ